MNSRLCLFVLLPMLFGCASPAGLSLSESSSKEDLSGKGDDSSSEPISSEHASEERSNIIDICFPYDVPVTETFAQQIGLEVLSDYPALSLSTKYYWNSGPTPDIVIRDPRLLSDPKRCPFSFLPIEDQEKEEDRSVLGDDLYGRFLSNGDLIARPLTYTPRFLVAYDASAFDEQDVATWDSFLKKAEDIDATIQINDPSDLAQGFLEGAGAKLSLCYDEEGNVASFDETYSGPLGLLGAKAYYDAVSCDHVRRVSGMGLEKPSTDIKAFVVNEHCYKDAMDLFGENIRYAPLPRFNADGSSYPTFNPAYALGVAIVDKTRDEMKSKAVMEIAKRLVSSEGADAFIDAVNQTLPGPSFRGTWRCPVPVRANTESKLNPIQECLHSQYSTAFESPYSGAVLDRVYVLSEEILSSDGSEESLQTALTNFHVSLEELVTAG